MPASPSKARRAFTLIELLISSVLLLLMLGAAYEALVLATGYHKKLADKTQIQQETMTVLGRLERAIGSASVESLEVAPDGTAIRFISARSDNDFFDLDPSGAPRWYRWVGIYLENTTLVYKENQFPPPYSNVLPASYPSIDDIKLNTSVKRSNWSEQVSRLLFEDGASTILTVLETQSKAQYTNGLTVLTRVHVAQ